MRLWDVGARGLLISYELGAAKTTVGYVNATTDQVEYLTLPACLVERPGAAQRFALCDYAVDDAVLARATPAPERVSFADGSDPADFVGADKALPPHFSYLHATDAPDGSRAWTNLAQAVERDVTGVYAFRAPVTRAELKQGGGIADVRAYWQLHKPADLHRVATFTPPQLLAIYLSRVFDAVARHINTRAVRAEDRGTVSSVLPVVPQWYEANDVEKRVRGAVAALASGSTVRPGTPVEVLRFIYREYSSIHATALDQLGECLHTPLTVLHVHYARGCFSAKYTAAPLSSFLEMVPGGADPTCGTGAPLDGVAGGDTVSDRALAVWQAQLDANQLNGVSDVIFSGDRWAARPGTADALASLIRTLAAQTLDVPRPHDLAIRVHAAHDLDRTALRAAATVLLQQHATCTCGKRHPFLVRCEVATVGERAEVAAASTDAQLPVPLDLTKPADGRPAHVYALHDLYARVTANSRVPIVKYLGESAGAVAVTERGLELGGDRSAVRVDPKDVTRRATPRYRMFKAQVPPGWVVRGCLNTRALPILHSGRDVVLNYYVVDKRWFKHKQQQQQ
ncbi:hypothetical protein H9P43_005587 [Blastocladiella emersonii ATCC 22665]|nr:hypothetical protein H9P43_005587 [Blastocladiella emersonii ATCC 22665]